MANWRRAWWPGGTWFFTVNLLERRNNRLLVEQIDLLRKVDIPRFRVNVTIIATMPLRGES